MHFSLKVSLMRRWRVGIIIWFFIFATLTENTSLLVNNSNISLLFPPDTLMVITCAGVYGKLYCVYLKQNSSAALTALCCCGTLNTVESLLTDAAARLVLFPPARQFFSSLIDGCLKYKHKEKPKSLNYDVKIGPIEARSGSGWNAGL